MNIVTWDIEIPVPDTHLTSARAVIEEIRDYRYMNPDWNFLVVPRQDNPILADGNNLLDRRYLKHIKTNYDKLLQ